MIQAAYLGVCCPACRTPNLIGGKACRKDFVCECHGDIKELARAAAEKQPMKTGELPLGD